MNSTRFLIKQIESPDENFAYLQEALSKVKSDGVNSSFSEVALIQTTFLQIFLPQFLARISMSRNDWSFNKLIHSIVEEDVKFYIDHRSIRNIKIASVSHDSKTTAQLKYSFESDKDELFEVIITANRFSMVPITLELRKSNQDIEICVFFLDDEGIIKRDLFEFGSMDFPMGIFKVESYKFIYAGEVNLSEA